VSEARPFPWDAVLHFAFRVLRWPPETVWRATPREIAAALRGLHGAAEPLGGAELAVLMNLYPDGR
jgi:uncharacterized phage protein (TIGR02216 family)